MNNRRQELALEETQIQINVLENSLSFYAGLARNYTKRANELRLDGFTREADSFLRLANKYTIIEQDAIKDIHELKATLPAQPIDMIEVEYIVERYHDHSCPMRDTGACDICEDYGVAMENHPQEVVL